MEWLEWLWLGIFLGALAFEFVTADLVSIWFSLGAIPSYVLSLFSVNPVIQILMFFIVTAVLLFFTRPVVMKYFKTNEIKTNVDSVIGQHAICVEEISADVVGAVKLKSLVWSAISTDLVKVGDHVRILDVEGVKLIVEQIEK
jgi:membrane protein implicated in regulation of membrane protease activity